MLFFSFLFLAFQVFSIHRAVVNRRYIRRFILNQWNLLDFLKFLLEIFLQEKLNLCLLLLQLKLLLFELQLLQLQLHFLVVILVIADSDGMASCELVLASRKEIIIVISVIIVIIIIIFGSFIENMRNWWILAVQSAFMLHEWCTALIQEILTQKLRIVKWNLVDLI